jgi:hypothetical protein
VQIVVGLAEFAVFLVFGVTFPVMARKHLLDWRRRGWVKVGLAPTITLRQAWAVYAWVAFGIALGATSIGVAVVELARSVA